MQFRTELNKMVVPGDFIVSRDDLIMTFGSCFADEIGDRLRQRLMNIKVNPAGTLFNPFSIVSEIERALELRYFTNEEIVRRYGEERFVTFSRHSRFSGNDENELVKSLNEDLTQLHASLLNARMVILTLGSAIGFKLVQTGEIVANCHKYPADKFERVNFGVKEIVDRLGGVIEKLTAINPGVKIVMTVSPVRHIGYGLTADRLSKSTLLVACHELCHRYSGNTIYFPAYEALTDDLRDYRFYAEDMVHPTSMAADYIMNYWAETFLSRREQGELTTCARLYQNAKNHSTDVAKLLSKALETGLSEATIARLMGVHDRAAE